MTFTDDAKIGRITDISEDKRIAQRDMERVRTKWRELTRIAGIKNT